MPTDETATIVSESAAAALSTHATARGQGVQLSVQKASPAAQRADVLVVGAFADGTLPPMAKAVDDASKGRLRALINRHDLGDDAGSTLLLYDLPGTATPRVLLVSLGPQNGFGDKAYFKALTGAAKALANGRFDDAAVAMADVDVPPGRSVEWRLKNAARILADGAYRFSTPRARELRNGSGSRKKPHRGAHDIVLLIDEDATPELETAVRRGQAVAEGMALTKDLGNLPGNVCHPAYLADTARALGKEFGFEVEVLEREDMQKLGMDSALSVGRASDQPCKFILMHYRGGKNGAKPIVLIGKGITFDTGGISLKPGADMDEMKFDMCGAASVFGAIRAVARMKLPINVIGIVPAHENMPGGNASRPGDVVTSMSGQTIEILNTDAEGRLILCDALTYAERFDPDCVIDVATLTGACVIALGNVASGLFANEDGLAAELLACGTETGDRAWQLPLWDDYQAQLKSNFADMANLGGRPAGTITAACFLSRFAKHYRWAHLDIAGTASLSGESKGATGRPVPLLSEFLIRRAEQRPAA